MSREPSALPDGIAIVGAAGRFPGARDLDQFWTNLTGGIESLSRLDDEALRQAGVPDKVRQSPRYVPSKGLLDDVDQFDASFFGVLPRDAELMDPQHRLFLECAWEALETAGYCGETYPGTIGVFGGAYIDTYLLANLCTRPEFLRELVQSIQVGSLQTELGNDKDYLATRVSYKLHLRGPSLTVQTACSTSLVAITQACQSLLIYGCDMALAGGVTVTVPQARGYLYQEDGMLSPDGHCRPFDAQARGTVFSNGLGLVVLKRMSDAIADRDTIWAVVRGWGLNNDGGSKLSYTAPSVDGQAHVIEMAHELAGIDPRSISYVEAHGTATPLGDPIELAALTRAFRARTADVGFCALGSVKSNIGHLDVASGVAAVIKTALCLRHRTLVPTLHYTAPNPAIAFDNTPFGVNTKTRPWADVPLPRRAGVSSFGVGGTNAHLVLEEAPEVERPSSTRPAQLLVLSARSAVALDHAAERLATYLAEPTITDDLADVAWTLQAGRKGFPHRVAVVARTRADAAAALRDRERHIAASGNASAREVVFMFPGQGAQHPGMARELYATEPVFRADVDRSCGLLEPELGLDLRDLLFPVQQDAAAARRLQDTWLAQPALFVVSHALARLWLSWGVRPALLVGHSVGELVAACVAEVFSVQDAAILLAARGRLMQNVSPGAMLSLRLPADQLGPWIDDSLDVAAVNAPMLSVVAGAFAPIEALETRLAAARIPHRRLATSHAFHSRMMDDVVEPFERVVRQVTLRPPRVPILSTVTGAPLADAEAIDPAYWAAHVRQTVRFADAVTTLRNGSQALLEVGPGQTLTMLAKTTPGNAAQPMIASLGSPDAAAGDTATMLEAAGRLWAAGVDLDWAGMHEHDPRTRVPLPTYPFERKRYWVDAPLADTYSKCGAEGDPEGSPLQEVNRRAADVRRGDPSGSPDPAAREITRTDDRESSTPADERHATAGVRFRDILHELSGLAPDEIADEANFLDLGLDSLLLTQVSRACQDAFAVKVTMRQLLDQTPTVGKVVELLAASMSAPALSAAVSEPAIREMSIEASTPLQTPSGFRPPDAIRLTLTGSQQAHLTELIASYTARTARSKTAAAASRPFHADPRTVSGFNRLWKEMVYPLVVERSAGSRLWDIDGNEYIDLLNGFGPNFLGHSPPFITEALKAQLDRGVEVGPMTPLAGEVAELFCRITGNDRVSFVNTGSEAVQAALRLARTVTGRDRVVVFSKDYHGNFDEVLVRGHVAHGTRRSLPIAPGIPRRAVEDVVVLDYGSDETLEYLERFGHELAAVLVEPIQSRRPEFQPVEFVREARRLTHDRGALLIFDEVITGLRLGPRGAQGFYGISADLATYGKVLGGGMPIGAVAGRADLMDTFDGGQWTYGDDSFPSKPVTFFAGTFVRHPLAMAAARATLLHLRTQGPELWERVHRLTTRLASDVTEMAREASAPISVSHFGSQMFVRVDENARLANLVFFHLRQRGVYLQEGFPSYLTAAHTDADIDAALDAWRSSLQALHDAGVFGEATRTAGLRHKTSTPVGAHSLWGGPLRSANPESPGRELRLEKEGALTTVGAEPRNVPISAGQLEIWLATRMHPAAACAYNEATTLRLRGLLDPTALHHALQTIVDRHDALRARFDTDGERMWISPSLPVEMTFVEASELPIQAQETRLAELVASEASHAFELERGPLVRSKLLHLADEDHVLLLTAHHAVCDGWSFNVVLEELSAFYSAAVSGGNAHLPAAPQFADWVAASGEQTRQDNERFWIGQFSTVPEPLALPVDRPHAAPRDFAGGTVRRRVGAELSQSLKALARTQHVTLFSLLLSLFDVLIFRLTGQTDFCVGVPSAGQSTAGLDRLIGHCVYFLPLRAHLGPEIRFSAHARAVGEHVLTATEHLPYTYGQLLERLPLPRVPGRSPLVEVQFNVERLDYFEDFAGLRASFDPSPKSAVTFDLFLNVIDDPSGLVLDCDFACALFDRDTIERWLGHFDQLLASAVADPDAPVASLPMLTDAERHWLTISVNDTGAAFPSTLTVPELIAQAGARVPEQPAVIDAGRAVSYRELQERTGRLAALLAASGVSRGDRVGVLLEPGVEAVATLLAILQLGAAFVPLTPKDPPARLERMLGDAGIRLVATSSELSQTLAHRGSALLCIDRAELSQGVPSSPELFGEIDPAEPAYVIFTSGSTGVPKGVEISHRSLVNLLTALARRPGIRSDDRVVSMTALSFDIALVELFLPLSVGATVVTTPRDVVRDGLRLREHLARSRPSLVFATPSLWNVLLESGWTGSSAVTMWTGGEVLPQTVASRLLAGGGRLWNLYGPTECTICSTAAEVDDPGRITIGLPIDNVQAYVLDPSRQLAAPGVDGELFLSGECVARGYVGDETLTSERFTPSPFEAGQRLYATGDRVRRTRDNALVYIGRLDTTVKLRGYRIDLGEVDAALVTCPDVSAVAATLEAIGGGEELVAHVVPRDGRRLELSALRAHAIARVPVYMLPTRLVLCDHLPLTTSGKIDRTRLRSPTTPVLLQVASGGTPWTETERVLATIWREVLDRPQVGVDDDFFALGGHSLTALRVVLRVGQQLGISIAPAALFEAPTIAALARRIAGQESAPPTHSHAAGRASMITMRAGGSRPPLVWLHGAAGEIFIYREVSERLAHGRPVLGFSAGWSGERGSVEPASIEQTAARYVEELRAQYPTGPYHLAGFCAGALLAYEMARQLELAGAESGFVGNFNYRLDDDASADSDIWRLMRNLPAWLHDAALQARSRGAVARTRSRLRRLTGRGDVRDELGMTHLPEESVNTLAAAVAAANAYQPGPLHRRLVFFAPDVQPLLGPFERRDAHGWERYASAVHVEVVPGSHESMFRMPHAATLAARVDHWLGVCDGARPASSTNATRTVLIPTSS